MKRNGRMDMTHQEEVVRVQATVAGRVQGVAFRWYTRDTASSLGICGWVRNLPDGSVEIVAEGPRDRIEQLLAWCRKGPSLAVVRDVQVNFEQPTGEFSSFSIHHA
jgi:acylphosphatase